MIVKQAVSDVLLSYWDLIRRFELFRRAMTWTCESPCPMFISSMLRIKHGSYSSKTRLMVSRKWETYCACSSLMTGRRTVRLRWTERRYLWRKRASQPFEAVNFFLSRTHRHNTMSSNERTWLNAIVTIEDSNQHWRTLQLQLLWREDSGSHVHRRSESRFVERAVVRHALRGLFYGREDQWWNEETACSAWPISCEFDAGWWYECSVQWRQYGMISSHPARGQWMTR